MFKSKSHKGYAGSSVKLPLNLAKICRDNFERQRDSDSTDGRVSLSSRDRRVPRSTVPIYPALHESDINLWNLQYNIVPGTLKWSSVESEEFDCDEGDYFGSDTQVESSFQIRVSLPPSNCILGAKSTFKLFLDKSGLSIVSYVSVDPSQSESVITEKNVLMNVSVLGAGDLQSIEHTGIQHEVNFKCLLALTGNVTEKAIGAMARPLKDIVADEQRLHHFQNGLDEMKVQDHWVLWPMKGRLTVRQTGSRHNFRVVSV